MESIRAKLEEVQRIEQRVHHLCREVQHEVVEIETQWEDRREQTMEGLALVERLAQQNAREEAAHDFVARVATSLARQRNPTRYVVRVVPYQRRQPQQQQQHQQQHQQHQQQQQ